MKRPPRYPYYFLWLSLLCLIACMSMGLMGGLQYVFPEFLKSQLSFERIRPLHTLFATSWILMAAIGGVYYYLRKDGLSRRKSRLLPWLHLGLFAVSGLITACTYFAGIFGGREYMEFIPYLAIPIILGWLLFAVEYFTSISRAKGPWPVYYWMWGTGIFFFIFTFGESFLWLFPYFRDNVVRDITVQWKANGALVGSWNMLVYGTSIYVLHKMRPDSKGVRGTLPFALFFVGLTNLMFGWAHHTYIVPSAPWIRHIAYAISMTEWLLLARIIYTWKKSLLPEMKLLHSISYRFLFAANVWVFINLFLALLISIPALNFYTHGTHITVAHAMGTTIGINTPLLLSSLFLILGEGFTGGQKRWVKLGFWAFNISLGLFFCGLIFAGLVRSKWLNGGEPGAFREMHVSALPGFVLTLVSGVGILLGLILVSSPLFLELRWRIADD